MIRLRNFLSVLLIFLIQSLWVYGIPDPTIKIYRKGFEVSIPHSKSTTGFNFTVKVVSTFHPFERGTFSGDIIGPDGNNHWTYKNLNAELQLGDKLYYSFTIRINNRDFAKHDLIYEVTSYEYRIPTPTIKVHPRGFEVLIPHEEAIESFRIDANIDSEIGQFENGIYSGTIYERDDSGCWKYVNEDAELTSSNILFYRITVSKSGRIFFTNRLHYAVNNYEMISTRQSDITHNLNIKVYRKGFRVSIPHEDGMEYFRFDANLNSELNENECGTFSGFYIDS
ncbi:Gram-negative bacteria-binding protein 3 [Eumeta japonica]|uniref:Gram-negative bacteria-binding protein 3 n=1 Tax=Eumeta variegata TaxID=151549 RepID=A0A4C1SUV4_EUMVA|nr:Gram-negative bacteria-binding protein 3 [Eumeta japonica]